MTRMDKYRWLVTGAAGFIGSHLVEELLSLGQEVIGLDNFSSGFARNLEEAGAAGAAKFSLVQGDIQDKDICLRAARGVDFILHHAALVSVPASVSSPDEAHAGNVNGFFNMLQAARECGVRRFIYASSSAVYGDSKEFPLKEEYAGTGNVCSPYAVTKKINEVYAEAWGGIYSLESIGLRYFNVFGPRQDPNGPYAAVISRWIGALTRGFPVTIYGDGKNTRDFCYVKNIVQANILAATTENRQAVGKVFNIACGEKTTLNELFEILKRTLGVTVPHAPIYENFRAGDIAHSMASIERAQFFLNYKPFYSLETGLTDMCARMKLNCIAQGARTC